jgi:regulator of protease activity HflC (stomatin/prohibitin superfamily)
MARDVQQELDQLGAGVEVVSVNVKDIHPPISVSRYFEGVIASLQEKQEIVNNAMGAATETRLDAEGEGRRLVEESLAYKTDTILQSQGDATRFLARIPAGSEAMRLTRKRLYLDAVDKALAGRDKVLFDPRAGSPEMWLNFDAAALEEAARPRKVVK